MSHEWGLDPRAVAGWPDLLVQTCLKHLEWRYRPAGEADLSMDGLVPPETQKRWHGKIAGLKFDRSAQERVAERMSTAVPEALALVARQRREAGLPAQQVRS